MAYRNLQGEASNLKKRSDPFFTLKIILVYVQCSLKCLFGMDTFIVDGGSPVCSILLYPYILIYPDISRFVLTDRLASFILFCVDSLLFVWKTRTGSYMFCDMFRFELDFVRCMYQNQLCKVMSCLRSFLCSTKHDIYIAWSQNIFLCM